MLDLTALWIGRAFLVLAGFGCASFVVWVSLEGWWRAIGRPARIIMLTAWQERARLKEAKKERAW